MSKFEMRTGYEQAPPLGSVGVAANFSGVANHTENLYVSQAGQGAYIRVGEEGT